SPQEQAWTTRASVAVAASRLQVRFMPIPPLCAIDPRTTTPFLCRENRERITPGGEVRRAPAGPRARPLSPLEVDARSGQAGRISCSRRGTRSRLAPRRAERGGR